MRVRNPKYAPPKEARLDAAKTALKTWLDSYDTSVEFIDFDEIRQQLPANLRSKAADGVIHQFLMDEGYEVDPG